MKLVEDRDIKTVRTQNEASSKLNERSRDVTSWKRELTKELDRLVEVTGKLNTSKRELEHAMEQIKRPEEVVLHCMEAREYRVGVDMVNDNVVAALKAEMNEIQRIREAMRQHHDEIEVQLMNNENVAAKLKLDLTQKREALDIDSDCFVLSNTSHEISQHPGQSVSQSGLEEFN